MTAFAPRSTALDTAIVMTRSLKEPVGFMPSNLTQTLAPVRRERASAAISGVPPSPRVTMGVASEMSNRSAYSRRTPRHWLAIVLQSLDSHDGDNAPDVFIALQRGNCCRQRFFGRLVGTYDKGSGGLRLARAGRLCEGLDRDALLA